MPHIELLNLTKHYPRQAVPALAGISLCVEQHTLLALLGPSGSGKSTVLRLIAGIEHPERGDIRLNGESILRIPAHRRSAVLMFQKAYLFPFLSVAENIAFGLRVQGRADAAVRKEIARMLELVELPGIEGKRPHQLSGGEQQRVALARALVVQPQVLLLDEPFSSLDPAVRQTLQEAVRRIQRELRITIALVTHDRSEAMSMADRVALLEQGHLVAHDTPQVLYTRPPNVKAARQMGFDTFLTGHIEQSQLQTPLGRFRVATAPADGPITVAIRAEHVHIREHPGPNTVLAELCTRTFRGETSDYLFQAAGQRIRVRTPLPIDRQPGDQLLLELPAEALIPVATERQP